MPKRYLNDGDQVFATGVFLTWNTSQDGNPAHWTVDNFEDDTYFDGACVNEVEARPYVCPKDCPEDCPDANGCEKCSYDASGG